MVSSVVDFFPGQRLRGVAHVLGLPYHIPDLLHFLDWQVQLRCKPASLSLMKSHNLATDVGASTEKIFLSSFMLLI
jgi:hypothetical protein